MTGEVETNWHPFAKDADEVPNNFRCDVCGVEFDGLGGPDGGSMFACNYECAGKNSRGHFHTYCKNFSK